MKRIVDRLIAMGWSRDAAEREAVIISKGDRYDDCPLEAAGFRLESFAELPTVVIGPDGKCICTKHNRCRDVDRRDGNRCTLEDLKRLDAQARDRRSWQSGDE